MTAGTLFESFVKIEGQSEGKSVFDTVNKNQQERLNSKVAKDLTNANVDLTVAKKLFQFWIHILQKKLTPEQRKMLQLFNVPEEPDNELDYLKYITALNIVSSSSVYLRIVKVAGTLVNGGLVFTLKKACSFVSGVLLDGSKHQPNWDSSVQKALRELANLISDPEEIAQLANDVMANRVLDAYEKFEKKQDIKLGSTSIFYSMMSKTLEKTAGFLQSVICNSGVLSTGDPFSEFKNESYPMSQSQFVLSQKALNENDFLKDKRSIESLSSPDNKSITAHNNFSKFFENKLDNNEGLVNKATDEQSTEEVVNHPNSPELRYSEVDEEPSILNTVADAGNHIF